MEVPREWLDGYTRQLNGVVDRGQMQLESMLKSLDYSRPVPELREALMAIMEMCCGAASKVAAQEAAIFYDGLRERVIGERMGTTVRDNREPIATEKAVKAFIKKLIEGDYDAFETLCLDRLDYEVKRAAGRCVEFNVGNDPYGEQVRYARVPTGVETCDFCIMLASRGPVYHTPESAGATDHYHKGCDCRVIPFWGTFETGPSRRGSVMSIEGYDPDSLYERYCDYMLNHDFRNRMARAADRARTGRTDSNAQGRETSHPMLWAKAVRDGTVTLKTFGEVQWYIRDATSYEDLFERIKLINKELPYYGLSSKYIHELKMELWRKRKEYVQ